ncbi:ECF-type sigma factor [Mariniblastus fucicola]|uniref:RNA polymerase sigma factor RpoE n=1 Tax=Mariniblastus fucicola TaxID=980251 RepID=A0A5B9PFP8_9BACT|nr:ECF-type sigma factor [Mariniblastus fucicola]QEG21771.1 RNA polymerase sigma factor RpoE [Mariniblastus fucicola]
MEMNSSVTDWITQLRNGHSSACDKLWPFYLQRLTAIICQKLESSRTEVSDEEDVLIDTCEVCFRKIKEGVYPNISSRHDLWRLLTKIATRKSIDQIRRSRKGVDRLRQEATQTINSTNDSFEVNHIDSFPGAEPTPEFAAMVADESRYRLSQLPEKMVDVVKLRLQGFTLKEIAAKTGVSLPTVQRYLSFVREAWSQDE